MSVNQGGEGVTWFRVDDDFAFHSKTLAAGNSAVGIWVRAGAWSSAARSDGVVPTSLVRQLGQSREVRRLVDAGLWVPVDGGGYMFHQWAERNPTREQVEQRREAAAERLKRWRDKQ